MWESLDFWKIRNPKSQIEVMKLMVLIWIIWEEINHIKIKLGICNQRRFVGNWYGEYSTQIGKKIQSHIFWYTESFSTVDIELHDQGIDGKGFTYPIGQDSKEYSQIRELNQGWIGDHAGFSWDTTYSVLLFVLIITTSSHIVFFRVLCLGGFRFKISSLFHSFVLRVLMAQLGLGKAKAAMVRTETVKISGSIMAQRIQQFSLTLIGRLMNPSAQRMESLVANMPKIWKLEDKVVGTDLGLGKFQFNFETEEDLLGVLQNVPYHFDGWMVSLVRWEPIIESTYPAAISFWVKITEIPLHFWEESTIRAIGKAIGLIREVDVDSASVYVTVNGYNPLIFQVVVPFDTGDEVVVSLEYEKLNGLCRHCFRLTHDVAACPDLQRDCGQTREERLDRRPVSGLNPSNQGKEGVWEQPRRPAAKRALEFSDKEHREGFPYKKDVAESSRYSSRRPDKHHSLTWARKNGVSGLKGDNGSKQWPKPLHALTIGEPVAQAGSGAAKEATKVLPNDEMGEDLVMSTLAAEGTLTEEKMEDGELTEALEKDEGSEEIADTLADQDEDMSDGIEGTTKLGDSVSFIKEMGNVHDAFRSIKLVPKNANHGLKSSPRGIGKIHRVKNVMASPGKRLLANVMKHKTVGTLNQRVKLGTKAGAANPVKKKGTVALPKPPANT